MNIQPRFLIYSVMIVGMFGCSTETEPTTNELSLDPASKIQRPTISTHAPLKGETAFPELSASQSESFQQPHDLSSSLQLKRTEKISSKLSLELENAEDSNPFDRETKSLLEPTENAVALQIPSTTKSSIDDARLKQSGIKKYEGKHVVLYSDATEASVKDLPAILDKAYPLWCAYFGLPVEEKGGKPWKVTAHLLANRVSKERFQKVGLWNNSLPEFTNGYSFTKAFYMYDQPKSDYYRRHLFLHEGVHSFMFSHFGTCGPAWYMEGMAELLATHQLQTEKGLPGKLQLPYFPKSKEEVPYLGRIKLVQDGYKAGNGFSIEQVLDLRIPAQTTNEPYAWSWALCAFLNGHPAYQARFQKLSKNLNRGDFNAQMIEAMRSDWKQLSAQWKLYVAEMEHNYRLDKTAIDFSAGTPVGNSAQQVRINSARGWQNAGIKLEKDTPFEITAKGRFQIANQLNGKPKIWWCEPNGISFRYYHDQPLGILQAAILPESLDSNEIESLWKPLNIGLQSTITPSQTGTLYLRINDSPGELDDNDGEIVVSVKKK